MQISEAFGEVHKLLGNGKGWTQYALARDKQGRRVHPTKPEACQYCLNGALIKVIPDETLRFKAQQVFARVNGLDSDVDIPFFNDNSDFSTIIVGVEKAKRIAEEMSL